MSVSKQPAKSLGEFIERVTEVRGSWALPNHMELWFRGESRDYGPTILRPELYRPAKPGVPLKPVQDLLNIENDLCDEFQRIAVERCSEKTSKEDWNWDSYFLMQHHDGPTRLLDWSDGALMALHFALRNKADDESHDACVYVLEPDRLSKQLKELPEMKSLAEQWRGYVAKHPSEDVDLWEDAYLPTDEKDRTEIALPKPPLVMHFPLITRRIAAQRSRFIVFGTEPNSISEEYRKEDSTIRLVQVARHSRAKIRQELRDCGVTESVIYPDLDGLGREMRQLWEDRR